MTSTADTLMQMYQAMHEHFGHQQWWPGDGALEICLGAILTQNTNWKNVEKALENLRQTDCIDITSLLTMPVDELAELIRPAGYYNIKAKRIRNFLGHIHSQFGDDIESFLQQSISTLREELLGITGIGRETADSIILYAAGKPTFVVDAYTVRIFVRHGLLLPEDDYETIKDFFESYLPQDADLFNDYHAQIVAVGKNFCKKSKTLCEKCPLNRFDHDPQAGMDD